VAVSLGYQNVYRYALGYPEWQKKGLPVDRTDLSQLTAQYNSTAARSILPPVGLALFWTLLGIFIGGMALNLTPCVYPLIPITVSYFGGRSGKGQGRVVAHGLCYLMGLSFTNSLLGVTAALTGGLMGAMLQNTWVLLGVAIVLLVFAASLFGLWEMRLPVGLTQAASKSYAGYFGSLFMGLTLGVIAAPCIGPFVLGLLTWVASIGLAWFGFIVFFTLSLGLGIPLFILALFSGRLEKLPRSGEWMNWVRKLMGWVLVGMAAYFARPLFPKTISVALYAIIALSGGIHLAWIDRSTATFSSFKWLKNLAGLAGIGFAIFLASSWFMQGPTVSWQPYSKALLIQAAQDDRPIIMDFYATWCSPCRELDETTFHDPGVVSKSKNFIMIKIDLTSGNNPTFDELIKNFRIKGVPTVVFLNPDGLERRDLRLLEFIGPAEFMKLMDKAL
jgi:thiol:disulfide interchange protein DsbD